MKIKPFKSDGCSFWFDGFWGGCCEDHDKDYYEGGSKKQRKKSDKKLRDCVYEKVKKAYDEVIAWAWSRLMYVGVRVGGVPWLPLPNARWGFKRHYKWGSLGYEKE